MTGANATCRVVHPSALTEAERAAWREIARPLARHGGGFLTWRYADAVGQGNPQARVAVLRAADGKRAFFAFQFKNGVLGRLGVAERIGGQFSDYFGLAGEAGFRCTPADLVHHCGFSALEFSHLDETQESFGLTGEEPRTGLRLDLPDGGPAFLADLRQRRKSIVRETDRRLRRLAEQVGPVRIDVDLRDRPDVLAILVQAKLAQYVRTGTAEGAMLAEESGQALIRRLYQSTDPDCRAQLSALYAGDAWVALHLGLRAGDVLHYWFPVYNPAFAAYGPGRLLLQKTIEASRDSGIACIDRGEGDNPTKRAFATSGHRYFRGLWTRPGAVGLVGGVAQRLAWRLGAHAARKAGPVGAADDREHGA
jgi:CelD/BcsL family acetyltransferase involved in cellulose biosynthesis